MNVLLGEHWLHHGVHMMVVDNLWDVDLSTVWILGAELRLSGLAAVNFTHWPWFKKKKLPRDQPTVPSVRLASYFGAFCCSSSCPGQLHTCCVAHKRLDLVLHLPGVGVYPLRDTVVMGQLWGTGFLFPTLHSRGWIQVVRVAQKAGLPAELS